MSMRLMRFKDGKEKALTLSYDDGISQDIRLVEIMNKYGIKGTFNLSSYNIGDTWGKRRVLSAEEIVKIYLGAGHEVAVHGHTHPRLDELRDNHCTYEILENRRILEEITGGLIQGSAYPYGTYNDKVVEILRMCGIKYARTTISTHNFEIPTDWMRMPSTCHHNDKELFNLLDNFINAKNVRKAKLFYLWGHSYEFDDYNNWDVIEKFCLLAGNRDDVWYATNIEIYDYVNAYNSLEVSVDGTRIYNPSLIDVWIYDNSVGKNFEGRVYHIKSGETITIKE